jgi:hypothetical protein
MYFYIVCAKASELLFFHVVFSVFSYVIFFSYLYSKDSTAAQGGKENGADYYANKP